MYYEMSMIAISNTLKEREEGRKRKKNKITPITRQRGKRR